MRMDAAGGFVRNFKSVRRHFSRDTLTTWTRVRKVFLLLIALQVVRMITAVKNPVFTTSQDTLNLARKIGFSNCDVDFKRGN